MACHREACGSAEGAGEGETDERGCGEEEGGCWSLRGLVSGNKKSDLIVFRFFVKGRYLGRKRERKGRGVIEGRLTLR